MNTQQREPVYRAAAETAYAELGLIAERMDQLKARQAQIIAAVEALKLVVGATEESGRSASKPVLEMNARPPQSAQPQYADSAKVAALA
jgi:hypothetical protein